jgi:antitoxin component of RelBE/YafQ-DinJ toxin-antitoxin module
MASDDAHETSTPLEDFRAEDFFPDIGLDMAQTQETLLTTSTSSSALPFEVSCVIKKLNEAC